MNLLWKTSRRGDLWIDERALVDLVRSRLPDSAPCQGATLLREQDLVEVRIALSSQKGAVDSAKVDELARAMDELFAPLGLGATLAVVKADLEERSPCGRLVGNPLCWGVMAATVTAAFLLGPSSVVLSLAVGVGFYGVAWLFLSPRGKDLLRSLLQK
ncbi:MAG: hypothetical protein JMJ93_00105 [Synergistaceae bacterium]|jgi:hypothetical protein|nr:hypothetical protein [Synergistaceae bacterium]